MRAFSIVTLGILLLSSCGPKWSESPTEFDFNIVTNNGGATLGYSPQSGVKIIEIDRYAFKDLNQNGQLDPYEDWRLDVDTRAKDLASRMTKEQIAGLMLYSGHQRIPGGGFGRGSTYNGKDYAESGANPYDLTDNQKEFLTDDNLRHVLITSVESPEVAARWSNNVQALVEGIGLGIPSNNSSDPRHGVDSGEEYNAGAGGDISRWPPSIGLAASFDPGVVKEFGEIASAEYRALGVSTALSPQIDLATDPRWYRFSGTFGESPELSTDMGKAYIDGFQTSSSDSEIENGWGYGSVNAMAKHWPGGGTGEGGRDAHYGFGKFAVFPGNNLETHMLPFTEGAFKLDGGTEMTSAIMPYYTISFDQNPEGENVGNAFSAYMINDLLRGKYGYDGVICTDWGVTRDDAGMAVFGRTPWGVEHLTESERHYKILMAGCDQFGGNNDSGPVIEAYEMGVKEHGEAFMRERFEKSAVRLLRNIFRVGLFENPYLDVQESVATVGNPEYMTAGYEAQIKSIVMLKNANEVMPINSKKVYIPKRWVPASRSWFGGMSEAHWEDPLNLDIAEKYVELVDKAEDADLALIVINSPEAAGTAGYSSEEAESGNGNGFLPISLQYDTYKATEARNPSLAGDDRESDVLNRSYKDKEVTANNVSDLKLVLETKEAMGDKPVIVVLRTGNPVVVNEFESAVDGILLNFGVQDQAIFDVVSGAAEPSALLPFQMPADMGTVERQYEDLPFDMVVHEDSEGNIYDFGFGLNWSGVIEDSRNATYRKSDNTIMLK